MMLKNIRFLVSALALSLLLSGVDAAIEPLVDAAARGENRQVQQLLRDGADVNETSPLIARARETTGHASEGLREGRPGGLNWRLSVLRANKRENFVALFGSHSDLEHQR